MVAPIQFNRAKFNEVFNDHLIAVQNMAEAMEAIGDPRDVCVVEVMKAIKIHLQELFDAVESGKKMLWHEFLFFPEIFRGFPDVHPFFAELLCGFLPMLDPEGLNPYIDAAENLGLPADICPADKGLIGAVLQEVQPPVDMDVAPTSPCDSAITAYQILQQLIEAPVVQCDVPYWQNERGVDLYEHHIWKMIRTVEEVCKTKMDWDRCKESMILANDAIESFIAENELRKLSPCPHAGKLGFYQFLTLSATSGTELGRDVCRFILEDAKRLAAEKKGAVEDEKVRLLMYNPDPFYDLAVHDWMEDEFGAVTATRSS